MIKELFKTIKEIDGLEENSVCLIIRFTDGSFLIQEHVQDCCESVYIAQVDSSVERHIGAEAYFIEEKSNSGYGKKGYAESYTETFYTLKTSKGYLDWRWVGESNGYYSESVDMAFKGHFKEL